MAWSFLPSLWRSNQPIYASLLNVMVKAITELQAAVDPAAVATLQGKVSTLESMPVPFDQTIAGFTWASVTAQNKTMSSVPTGVPVMGTAAMTIRLGSGYCVVQIFDGATQVGSSMSIVIPTGASAFIGVLTMPFAATFTNAPVLRFTLGSAVSTTVDPIAVSGLQFK